MLVDDPDAVAIVVVVALLLLLTMYQIFWMNKGLAAFRAQLVVPLGVTLTMVFSEILGGTFFDEFKLIRGATHTILFAIGFAVVLVGCAVIVTSTRAQQGVSSESLLGDETEHIDGGNVDNTYAKENGEGERADS